MARSSLSRRSLGLEQRLRQKEKEIRSLHTQLATISGKLAAANKPILDTRLDETERFLPEATNPTRPIN
jgi:hypothetical protein